MTASAQVPKMTSRQLRVLLSLSIFALMVMYVEMMIVPAIPTFVVFFGGTPISTVAWILTAYLLVGVIATPLVSSLGDIHGKKRMMVIVLGIYAVAATVAGFTPEFATFLGLSRPNALYVLIAVRAVQGIGVSILPLAFAVIGEEFPPQRLGVAQGILASTFAIGAALGFSVGAFITQSFGWQWTYHSIIPVAVAAPFVVGLVLRESNVRRDVPLDVIGGALLGGALGAFLVGVSEGPTWGWADPFAVHLGPLPFGVPVLLGLAIVLFLGFLLWEPRARNPMVDFRRLGERNIALVNTIGIAATASLFCFLVASQTFYQAPVLSGGFGLAISEAGLWSLPTVFGMAIASPIIGRSVQTRGPRPVLIGGGLSTAVGGILIATVHGQIWQVALEGIPALVGVMAAFIAMTNVVVLSSAPQERSIQVGINQTFRNVGATIGPVLAVTILASFAASVVVGYTPAAGTAPVPISVMLPTAQAYAYAFAAVAALGAIGAIASSFLRNYRFLADGTRVGSGTATPSQVQEALES